MCACELAQADVAEYPPNEGMRINYNLHGASFPSHELLCWKRAEELFTHCELPLECSELAFILRRRWIEQRYRDILLRDDDMFAVSDSMEQPLEVAFHLLDSDNDRHSGYPFERTM